MADPLSGSASTTRSSTLRPYYVAPSPEDFLASSSGSGARPAGTGRPVAPLPSRARVDARNLESSLYSSSSSSSSSSNFSDGSSVLGALQGMVNAGILGFLANAAVQPWEVGKVLMQVQWIPRADVELLNELTDDEGEDDQDVLLDAEELEDEDEAEAYFHDLNNPDARSGASKYRQRSHYRYNRRRQEDAGRESADDEAESSTPRRRKPGMGAPRLSVTRAPPPNETDAAGYIVRRSIFEQATKPEWILPFTVTGGVWDMMKAIARWKPEGWLALWKGQLVTFCMETAGASIQPAFFSILAGLFLRDVPFSNLPLIHIPSPVRPFFVTIFSHVLTGYLLSPVDLIRTRLIVQSSLPRHRKYAGPVQAFKQLAAEEGGLKTVYTHTSLVVPAVLDAACRSVFTVGLPLFLERKMRITLDGNPIIFGLAEFALSTASLLVILPIETVRRRLQIQSRAAVVGVKGRKSFKTCVETRPTPYAGIVETVYRILTEETGRLHLHNEEQKPRRPSMSSRRASTASGTGRPGMGSRRQTSYRTQQATPAQGIPLATPAREMREWEEEARAHDRAAAATRSGVSSAALSANPSNSGRPHPTGNPAHLSAENVNPIDLAFAHTETSALDIEDVKPEVAPYLPGLTQLYRGFSLGVGANFIVLVLGLIAGKERFDGAGGAGWTEM